MSPEMAEMTYYHPANGKLVLLLGGQ